VLPRNDVLDMEWNKRRRLLRHAAILTRIAGARTNKLPCTGVHATRIAWRGNGAPSPA
jgi:hypothetical protein